MTKHSNNWRCNVASGRARIIRRDIVKDKALSTYVHNVKIVSTNGKVTLRGPDRSDQEKEAIEQYAKSTLEIRTCPMI